MTVCSDYKDGFINHLVSDKKASKNTLQAYLNDLSCFELFLLQAGIDILDVEATHIEDFKNYLKDDGRAVSSVSRSLSSVRVFYTYLFKEGIIDSNPAKTVKNDKASEKHLDILTADEIDRLIKQPMGNDEKAIRDKAILELLYATGLNVSELVELNVKDFNETLSFIKCGNKERYIPLYPKAKKLLSSYLRDSRRFLISSHDENALFVNVSGTRMSRQGLWKLIKHYASEAGIRKDISPRMLRHSFAAHLLENGADVSQLKELLGHSDASSTNVYVNYIKQKMAGTLINFHPHA